ncbi:CGNR zinc finger domain-containing protein [uncultured Microbacterium sp.]|uniref:CGNR zinc finger domain-containing protein n=1 Tax=uncultured Microbacterium sp. TaxID=191216 RepID=UPI0025D90CD7|nr:CGNR zinc finger domain-containing protein [uncultured Microbacterium sp.]
MGTTTYPRVGGHPAFDLVDTVHWRLDDTRAIDTLVDFDAVLDWCAEIDLIDRDAVASTAPDVAAAEHTAIIALREAVYEAVFEDSPDAAALIAREHIEALSRSSLERDDVRWRWHPPADPTGPRTAIAFLAHDLLTSDLRSARRCGDEACGWVYLDTSPRHNRIWCTAAGCGNRNRVKRHHARSRT